jgi:hypothetical protein
MKIHFLVAFTHRKFPVGANCGMNFPVNSIPVGREPYSWPALRKHQKVIEQKLPKLSLTLIGQSFLSSTPNPFVIIR